MDDITRGLHESAALKMHVAETQGSIMQAMVECMCESLQQGGKHAEAQHIRTLLACAEICRTSADFMLLGTDLHKHTCGACAEVCDRCIALGGRHAASHLQTDGTQVHRDLMGSLLSVMAGNPWTTGLMSPQA